MEKKIDDLKDGECIVVAKSEDIEKRFRGIYNSSLRAVFFTIPSHYQIIGYIQK